MAIKVFKEFDNKEEDVYLQLREDRVYVRLVLVNKDGGFLRNLLEIHKKGIKRCCAAAGVGIETENGKIVILE